MRLMRPLTDREIVLGFVVLVGFALVLALRSKFEGDEGLRWEQACADPSKHDWIVPDCDDPLGTGR